MSKTSNDKNKKRRRHHVHCAVKMRDPFRRISVRSEAQDTPLSNNAGSNFVIKLQFYPDIPVPLIEE